MLLVVQLVWVVLVQRFDYFLLSVHACIGRFGQGCLYERSGYGGGCLLLVVGVVVGRCGLR